MKNENKNTNPQTVTACVAGCSRSQKIWGVVALVGLFACGWMVGVCVNSFRTNPADADAAEIVADKWHNPIAENQVRDCEVREQALWEKVGRYIDGNDIDEERDFLVTLLNNGCAENRDAYNQRIEALDTVKRYKVKAAKENATAQEVGRTCVKIENEVSAQLCNGCGSAQSHIRNAQVYANLSERGCPENADKYVALAKQELELARAVNDDRMGEGEAVEVVETYKRLHMQAAAEEILDKVKKLTNPAIDFIIQMEKIINE